MSNDLAEWVQAASQHEAACAAVHALYDRLGELIAARKPICTASGECCRFDAYGHRLYVTTLELGTFVRDLALQDRPAKNRLSLPQSSDGCAYQIDGLCSVHAIRPFGCRIFFCDPTATAWQQELYEKFHAELRQLHGTFGVRYAYVEWRAGLREQG